MEQINPSKLRRLARRVLHVLDGHSAREPVLGAFVTSLKPAAERYIDIYDRLRSIQARDWDEIHAPESPICKLAIKVKGWATLLKCHVPSMARANLGECSSAPEELLREARRVARIARHAVGPDGLELKYASAVESDLGPAMSEVERLLAVCSSSRVMYYRLHADLETVGERLWQELVAFRRVLALVLGLDHPDLAILSLARACRAEDIDDPEPCEPVLEGMDSADEALLDRVPIWQKVPPPPANTRRWNA